MYMNPIFPILHLHSTEMVIDASSIDNNSINNFGNGFFISKDGLIASVAHVFKCKNGINPYALLYGKLHKINILSRKHTTNDVDHLDAAIGKLELTGVGFFDPMKFKRVKENSILRLDGFSRKLAIDESPQSYALLNTDSYFYKIEALMFDMTYGCWNNAKKTSIIMKKSFTIILKSRSADFGGMSGCPVRYKEDLDVVVGIFKGGANIGNKIKGHAIHIDTIKKMFLKLK